MRYLLLLLLSGLIYGNLSPQKPEIIKNTESANSVFKIISSDEKGFRIIYNSGKSDFKQIKRPEGDFIKLMLPYHASSTETGKPQLPVISHLIDYNRAKGAKIKISRLSSHRYYTDANGLAGYIYPRQPAQTKSSELQDRPLVIDHSVYKSKKLFFFDTISIKKIGIMRGRTLGTIEINPVVYNPAEKYFDLITSMVVDVEYAASSIITGTDSKESYSVYFNDLLAKGMLDFNPEDVIPDFTLEPAGMIIVTDTTLKKFIAPLVEWKTQKGYKVSQIIIGEKGQGETYADIKQTLTNIYNNSSAENQAPSYLILAGDLNYIPASDGTNQLSDLYYAEFDGNGDYLPDMFVGRLPASDSSQMKSIINKIIQYERFLFGDSIKHFEKAVAVTGLDGGHAIDMNGQVNYAASYFSQNPNATESYIFNHQSNDSIRNVRYDSLKVLMNEGVGFINYTGHGSASGWVDTGIDYSFIAGMTNISRYPFVISNACLTGKYNNSSCLGSSFVRADSSGAIAFIGCSNNSYWDEDYFFAVGVGPITSNPTYEDTGLGFYDRLFHLNNEKPSEWYTTTGQIMFSGNLSVSASTSTRKQYYWETYNLMGDPSLSPIIGEINVFNTVVPDTIPHALLALSINTDPFAYVAVSHFDTLWDASHATSSGYVSLDLPAGEKDSCLIVITGQNKIPLIKTVYFNGSDTAWMNINNVSINDQLANNNDLADYSEDISLNIKLQNAGNSIANNVYLLLDTDSEYITINNDSVFIDTFDSSSEQTINDLFEISVADSVPDLESVPLLIELHYNGNSFSHYKNICLHAPELRILYCITEDDLFGNGNGLAEAGERVNVIIRITNTGSSTCSGNLIISNVSPYLDFDVLNLSTALIEPGMIIEVSVYANIDASAPEAEEMFFDTELNCSPYKTDKTLSIIASKSTEDFEQGNFTTFPWLNSSDNPWFITEDNAYSNYYSARSGIIAHSTESVLALRLNMMEDDTLRFWYKVSSEGSFDNFKFWADSVEIINTSAAKNSTELDWTFVKHPLTKGVHLLQWIYAKDGTVYAGSDCAWIDFVRFPVQSLIQNAITLNEIITPEKDKQYKDESISVEITNLGRDTLNSYSLSYIINDSDPVDETFSEEFIPGDTITVVFSQTVDMSEKGDYEIEVFVTSPDNFFIEDTIRLTIISVGINDVLFYDDSFTIAPNPIKDNIRVLCNGNFSDNYLELYNSNGMLISKKYVKYVSAGEIITIPAHELSKGIYTLQIRNIKGKFVYKLLKL